jgi:RNA polymerase sigma-70 factor (sigma-E family)
VQVASDEAGYREFVTHRMDGLRRTAYLLCGDWHTADDLVSTALVKLLRHWRRVAAMEQPDADVRQMLLRAYIDEKRRPWRREDSVPAPPDRPQATYDPTDRLAILAHLAQLPARRRAVIVLRYYCDLSVEETAAALGCSEGTVKSQTARALETLRTRLVNVSVTEG